MKVKLQVAAIALMAVLAAVTPLTARAQLGPNTATYTPDTTLAGGVTDVTQLAVATDTIITDSFKVTVRQEVWRNSAGFLDFYYQVTNVPTAGKTGVIHRVTVECFGAGTIIPAAGWVASLAGSGFVAGTDAPGNVTRDGGAAGDETVGFDHFGGLGIVSGETSQILFVQTERRNFVEGSVGLINGHPGFSDKFYGIKCVPEPAMVQLSSLAGLGLLGLLRFRKRKA